MYWQSGKWCLLAAAWLAMCAAQGTDDNSTGPDAALLVEHDQLHCVARGTASYSAMAWITPIEKYRSEPRSDIVREKTYGFITGWTGYRWNIVSSFNTPAPSLVDSRWEDLTVTKTTKDITRYVHLGETPRTESWDIGLSVRAAHDAQILLCGEGRLDGDCYWIILGGWYKDKENVGRCVMRKCTEGSVPKGTEYPEGECENVTARHESLMVSENRWLHLRLKWNVRKDYIAVWEQGDGKPFLKYKDVNLFRPKHLLVRSREVPALWKLHKYTFRYTEEPGSSISSGHEYPHYDRLCIALQYFVSPRSSLEITAFGVTFQEYRIQDDGEWHEIHFVSESGITQINSVGVTITAVKGKGDEPSRFGIGNIRECNPDGDIRISTLSREKEGSCQLIQYKGVLLKSGTMSVTADPGCANDKVISHIGEDCGRILARDSCYGVEVCTPQNNGTVKCCCVSGWQGAYCSTSCGYGTYGPGCTLSCGQCTVQCDAVDGTCNGACKAGYRPRRCQDTYPVFVSAPVLVAASYRTLEFQVSNFTYTGVGTIQYIRLEYKIGGKFGWRNLSGKPITDGSVYTAKIIGLDPGMEYRVRAIIIDKSDEFYDEDNVPYIVVNTICDEPTISSTVPGRRNVTVTLKERTELSCPWQWFRLQTVPEGEVRQLTTPVTMKYLNPHQEYEVLLLRDGNITSRTNFTTLQDAPTEVLSPEVFDPTSSTIRVQWKPPVPANGDILGYIISYQHESYRACKNGQKNDESQGTINSTEQSVLLEDLLPYSRYRIGIRAVTVEEGPETQIEGSTEEVDFPPVQPVPSNLSGTIYSTMATVRWGVPECTTLQGPGNTFQVVINGTSDWNRDYYRVEEVKIPYFRFENLTPFSGYDVSVYVQSSTGVINPDLPYVTTFTTQPDGPPAVRDLESYSHGPDWISLRWRKPWPPHGVLQGYREKHSSGSWARESEQDITNDSRECSLWPGMTCCTIKKPALTPDMEYIVQMNAYNENNLPGKWTEVKVATSEGVSSPPINLTAVDVSGQNVTLQWNHPWLPRGSLMGFTITPVVLSTHLRDRNASSSPSVDILLGSNNKSSTYSYTVTVPPSTEYKILLRAYSSVQGDQTSVNVSTPVVPPKFRDVVTVNTDRITNSTVQVVLPTAPEFLTDESSCFIVVTLLDGIMGEVKDTAQLYDESVRNDVLALARDDSKQLAWIAAEIQLTSEPQTFTVGKETKSEGGRTSRDTGTGRTNYGTGYTNHPLGPKCTYQVTVVAVSEQDGMLMYSASQLQEPVTTRGKPIPPTHSHSYLLALLVLLLLVPAVGYFIVKRYRKGKKKKSADEICLHVPEKKPGTSGNTFDADRMLGVKVKAKPPIKEPEPELEPDFETPEPVQVQQEPLSQRLSHRVALNKLEEYVKVALVSGELQRQHALFPRGATQPCEYGRLPENKSKNRYGNLTAYDATRVVLKKLPDDPFSDYINANYIDGYKCPKFYIATQGPRPTTVVDFWRMVWQERVQVICMLTNVVENGKTKCEQYWPDLGREATYGEVTVLTTSSQVFADYTFRRLLISHKNKKRTIQHFHFTSWPDHGVPLYPQSVAAYLKKVLAAPKGSGPIVVHCSAGVGRTGTIILSDVNLRMAAAEEAVDVLQFQQLIREQRSNLVDNLDQYKLVHLVLLECLIEDPTEMSCEGDFGARVRELRTAGGTDRQFLRLHKHQHLRMATKNPLKDVASGPNKNRNQDIIPGPSGRIFLSQIYLDDPTSTYINAVSVDGFRIKNQFVATEFPLADTVGDFWRMVLEKNISLILILNEVDLNDKLIVEFLPKMDASLMPSPHISVKLNQVTDSERWTLKFFQINYSDSQGGAKQVSVRLLEFKGWMNNQALPPSAENLLLLWHEAERLYMGKGPILVTCLDGTTACGLFLSLAFVVEKIKLEQLCDVCLAVRTVRQHRGHFIGTQEQFEFLYDAATTYLEAFQTYANFQ